MTVGTSKCTINFKTVWHFASSSSLKFHAPTYRYYNIYIDWLAQWINLILNKIGSQMIQLTNHIYWVFGKTYSQPRCIIVKQEIRACSLNLEFNNKKYKTNLICQSGSWVLGSWYLGLLVIIPPANLREYIVILMSVRPSVRPSPSLICYSS